MTADIKESKILKFPQMILVILWYFKNMITES